MKEAHDKTEGFIEDDTFPRQHHEQTKNVLGTKLNSCCSDPITGFLRDGYCNTNLADHGTHVVCAVITDEFLRFTKSRGNDLGTPLPPLILSVADVMLLPKIKTNPSDKG
jgi:uncharacterized protein (DUF2237 family)